MPSGGGAEQTLTTPGMATISVLGLVPRREVDTRRGGSPARKTRDLHLPDCGGPSGREANAHGHLSSRNESLSSPFLSRSEVDQLHSRQSDEAGISTIYVVPASGGEWRRVTEAKYFDDKPRWSPDGRRLYFVSNRTGFFNVWGIDFDPASGQPRGEPFRVTNFESPAQMVLPEVGVMEMALAADRIVLPIMEVSGGIWILENVGR